MDEFAQTRAPDDLFDDDFTPVQGATQPASNTSSSGQSKQIPQSLRKQTQQPEGSSRRKASPSNSTSQVAPNNPDDTHEEAASPAATGNATPRPAKAHQAVRGDRLATGGTPKPKLTEDELSERLAAAKLNSAKRAEAHRLAEADEASFQQREARAALRRQDETKARRAMDMEREKNRLRKLEAGAKGGREWDEGKEPQVVERDRGFRRGVNGGVGGTTRGGRPPRLEENGDFDQMNGRRGGRGGRGRGRGRGDRGDRGGRGGRGGQGGFAAPNIMDQQPPDPAVDFPALPTPAGAKKPSVPPDKVGESLKTVEGKSESWADQVEAKES